MLELKLRDGVLHVFTRYEDVDVVGHAGAPVEGYGMAADDRVRYVQPLQGSAYVFHDDKPMCKEILSLRFVGSFRG